MSYMLPPVAGYVKKGLAHCYLPEKRSWSYIYHLDGRPRPNESIPAGDCFYSLNVILGLAAAGPASWQDEYDLPALLQENARRLFELRAPTYALGMALWASAELDERLKPETNARIRAFLKDRSRWRHFRAQDAGMILTGISEQSRRGNGEYDAAAHELFHFIERHYLSASGLFFDEAGGLRRNFSSFATQTYLTNACYHYGERYGSRKALMIADAAAKKLIALQGPDGEWPWFYFTPRGLVVDHYEVYSVHQHGMAPLFLNIAERRGIPGAREATIRGFRWIFGNNQLQQSMMVPELGMFYRSIIRRGELSDKRRRMRRAMQNAARRRPDILAPADALELRRECRSYELGWLLYSFGNRHDMPEITHHEAFGLQPLTRYLARSLGQALNMENVRETI